MGSIPIVASFYLNAITSPAARGEVIAFQRRRRNGFQPKIIFLVQLLNYIIAYLQENEAFSYVS
jgi:hypothetical protein